jgi:hypothetical protein
VIELLLAMVKGFVRERRAPTVSSRLASTRAAEGAEASNNVASLEAYPHLDSCRLRNVRRRQGPIDGPAGGGALD